MTAVPHTIGPYHTAGLISISPAFEVWQGRGQDGIVAIKRARQDQGVAQIQAEIKLLSIAAHPHVARLGSHGEDWLATKLIHGTPLHHWTRDRSMREIYAVLLEISGTLRDLHIRGVIHGDIKPANVLVDRHGHAKIVDISGPQTRGTLGYCAPEVLRGQAVSKAADRYAFGCLAYTALTGQHAFDAVDAATLVHRPDAALPVAASAWCAEITPHVDRLLLRLLAREPSRRPSWPDIIRTIMHSHRERRAPPVLGMHSARRVIGEAVGRASDGEPVVLVIHGPIGSGRRTLAREAMRLAQIEGMTYLRHTTEAAFVEAAKRGDKPAHVMRLGPAGSIAKARNATQIEGGSLLVTWSSAPMPPLFSTHAIHISPPLLSQAEALKIGAWLGVTKEQSMLAWRESRGLPTALWLALVRHMPDAKSEIALRLPSTTAKIVHTLRQLGGSSSLEALRESTDITASLLADHLDLLLATGRVACHDGETVRLIRSARGA